MKRINRLITDSSSVLMACLHAAKGKENSILTEFNEKEEIVPSAVDGYEIFLQSLEVTMKDLGFTPNQVILVKDGKNSRSLRRKIFPPYKSRPEKNPVFLEQFNIMQGRVEETLLSYGALSVVKDGYEADDLIAAIWKKGDIIWSKDGDLLAAGDWYYGRQTNPDKFLGIPKKHIVVYKSLVGDASDKIPGAKGFGKKAFEDMLLKFGDDSCDDLLDMLENDTLDELKDYVSDFKPFAKVLEFKEKVKQSYYCAKFHHPGWDLEWSANFPEANGDLIGFDRTEELVTASNLDLSKIKSRLADSKGYIALDIETYEDEESIEWGLRNKSSNSKTGKLDVFGSHMTGLSLTCGSNNQHVYYFSVNHADTDNLSLDQLTEILNMIPDNVDVCVHNALFELPIVRMHCELRFDRGWLPNVLDTQIEKSYVNENESPKLKDCAKHHLNYNQTTYEEVTQGRRMNEIPASEVLSYGADDSVVSAQLHSLFRAIMDYEGTSDAFDTCEQWSAYQFAESFVNGIKFDKHRLEELTEINRTAASCVKDTVGEYLLGIDDWPGCEFIPAEKLTAVEIKRLYEVVAGEPLKTRLRSLPKLAGLIEEKGKVRFAGYVKDENLEEINSMAEKYFQPEPILNMGSPKQKCHLLYDLLKYPVRLRGKVSDKMRSEGKTQGNPQANEAAFKYALINDAKSEFEKDLLNTILQGVSLNTEFSLFLRPYKEMPNPKDGLVHYGTGHSKTTSRRNAPSGPNIAQVSKKTPIREIYVPYEGDCWLSLDWSGQELLLTAFRSQCSAMLKCYPLDGSEGMDIHSLTGCEILKLEGTDIDYKDFISAIKDDTNKMHKTCKDYRNRAKAVNFGDLYNISAMGLSMDLMISEEKAEDMLNAKAKAFPGVAKWKKDRKAFFLTNGFAVTMLGARKHLEFDGSWRDESILRSAGNYEIQGSAGEQMKLSVSRMWLSKFTEKHEAYFLFPVHDELNNSVDPADLRRTAKDLHNIMCSKYADMNLPIKSSIEVGSSFGTIKEVELMDIEG